ncbi:MAG: endonuclease/exonuclease/phosphatase family protein [Verrucomicrobiales bacterium]|nr:endonuclease/exonuclease/phosphatase family protein [Verrucomicrobiales bacterium]
MPNLKVATWNVENLFAPGPDATPDQNAHFERKLALLAGVIREIDPDVLALQEVGGEAPLQALQNALGGGWPHRVVSDFPDGRGIRVAFLSKLAPEHRSDIVDFPPGPALEVHRVDAAGEARPVRRMGRGALRLRVRRDGFAFDIVTAHLKSKLLSYPRPYGSSFTPRNEEERAQTAGLALMRRSAEAVTLRLWANALLEGNDHQPLILLGDLNDVPEAQTSLLLNGPEGSEIGTRGFDTPDQGDDTRLFNLAGAIPEGQPAYSRVHRGRGELLDQIFASVEFFPRDAGNQRRRPAVKAWVDFATALPSVTDNPGDRAAEVAPDHAPVSATFDV